MTSHNDTSPIVVVHPDSINEPATVFAFLTSGAMALYARFGDAPFTFKGSS
jgi:hypothetical protein